MDRQHTNHRFRLHRTSPISALRSRWLCSLIAGAVALGACGGTGEDDASNSAGGTTTTTMTTTTTNAPTTATASPPRSTLEADVQAELDALPAVDVGAVDTTDPEAEARSAVLPNADQLLAMYPSPIELSEGYFEFLMPGFLAEDAIITNMSVVQSFEDFSQTTIQTTRATYISAMPTDQLAATLKVVPQSPWGLTEESTRKGPDGDIFELAFERGPDAGRGPDQLTFRLGRDSELDVTVVELVVSDYTDATEIGPGLMATLGYETDFGFELPQSCVTQSRLLMVTTFNPRVPLNPSWKMTWSCATDDVVAVREAITTAMAADPRFDPKEWETSPSALVPPANDELVQFGHGAGPGQWRVFAEKDPEGAVSVEVQLSLSSPFV